MGVFDSAVHIGRETGYGAPAPLTRSIESTADGHKRAMKFLESNGMRAGMQATGHDRTRAINMGAEGGIPVDLMTKGMGMLLRAMTGASSIAQVGASAAWLQTHSTTKDGPSGESLTVQIIKPPVEDDALPFTYHGGKPTSWSIEQSVDDLAKLKLDMDYEDEETDTPAGVPSYATGTPFAWEDCVVTVDGTPVDLKKIVVKANNGLDVERRFLRGSSLKKEPRRKSAPVYDGELTSDFENLDAYQRFVSGAVVPLVATWTGEDITPGVPYMLRVTAAAVQFRGDTPSTSLTELAEQPMPFKVLWNRVDPAVKLEYRSTDTDY